MAQLLFIPIVAFFLSFPISYVVRGRKWDGKKISRAYFGKFFWGFRTFLFPSISLFILYKHGLRPFCISLLIFAFTSILVNQFLQIKVSNSLGNKIGFVWYLFLGLTYFLNDPYWIQIYPSLFFGSVLVATILVAFLKKSTQFSEMIFQTKQESDNLRLLSTLNWLLPVSSLALFFLNEFFRRETSFDVWAFYNAFWRPIFVIVISTLTIIFVPIFLRD